MKRRPRWHVVGFACLAAAALIGFGAIVDHHWKNVRSDRAELAEWYCEHQGTRCGGVSSAGIEVRWNERELGYLIAVSILGTVGAGLLAAGRLRSLR